MAVTADRRVAQIKECRAALNEWFEQSGFKSIGFLENLEPASCRYDDYIVCYEAIFEPASLDQMRVELWFTDDGFTGIWLESRERIAKRLSIKNRASGSNAGHEPFLVEEHQLFKLLESVAAGAISIGVHIGLLGMDSFKAIASSETRESLARAEYRELDWLSQEGTDSYACSTRVLKYRSW